MACGNLQKAPGVCQGCSHQELMSVFKAVAQCSFLVGQVQHTRHNRTCPSCGNRNRLLLICARNATQCTQVVKHSWAGPFNDDRKLIAFSDFVQDAAHRAGFLGCVFLQALQRLSGTRQPARLAERAIQADWTVSIRLELCEFGAPCQDAVVVSKQSPLRHVMGPRESTGTGHALVGAKTVQHGWRFIEGLAWCTTPGLPL